MNYIKHKLKLYMDQDGNGFWSFKPEQLEMPAFDTTPSEFCL